MRATVNPKPVARNGSGRLGSTEEWSASLGQVEASKGRSRQRRKSESHEAILCRAARTRCVRSGVKRSRETSASGCVSDRSVPKPTALQKSPHHRSRHHHHSYPRITPSRPQKGVIAPSIEPFAEVRQYRFLCKSMNWIAACVPGRISWQVLSA